MAHALFVFGAIVEGMSTVMQELQGSYCDTIAPDVNPCCALHDRTEQTQCISYCDTHGPEVDSCCALSGHDEQAQCRWNAYLHNHPNSGTSGGETTRIIGHYCSSTGPEENPCCAIQDVDEQEACVNYCDAAADSPKKEERCCTKMSKDAQARCRLREDAWEKLPCAESCDEPESCGEVNSMKDPGGCAETCSSRDLERILLDFNDQSGESCVLDEGRANSNQVPECLVPCGASLTTPRTCDEYRAIFTGCGATCPPELKESLLHELSFAKTCTQHASILRRIELRNEEADVYP